MGDAAFEERRAAVRRFMVLGTSAWLAFVVTDVIAAYTFGAPLPYLLGLRAAGAGVGLAALLAVRAKDADRRAVAIVESSVFPAAALFVSLAAIFCGGATSPLAHGVGAVTLARAIIPAPWTRSLPSALAAATMFPIVMFVAQAYEPHVHEQMHGNAFWSFALTSVFLAMVGCVAAAGSHVLWVARRDLQTARRLGQYRLVARIGSGGMGEVWVARQLPLDRPVALKLLKKREEQEEGSLRRFTREAKATSRLTNPHTVKIHDFGASDDGVCFIVMELLDGLDVEQLVGQSGALPPARAIHVARQACASLAEAHAHAIIHCDIKPANVFVAKVGEDRDFVKVLDFGLARVLHGPGATTVADSIRGTPAFMPPEVVRGESVGPDSDVYSMGALLYFMLTGTPVFEGLGFHETIIAQLERVPDLPSKRLGRELPADLERIVMRCLAKDRGQRFADAKALDDALAKCELANAWTAADAREAWSELRPSLAVRAAPKLDVNVR